MGARRDYVRRETGQVLILFALALPVLLGMSALVVDVGNLFVQKRSLQKAADAAALAATQSLDGSACAPATPCNDTVAQLASDFNQGNDPVGSAALPQCDASLGVTENCYDLVNDAEVICAPTPPDPSCIPVRVQVRVSRPVSLFFGFLIGKSNIDVHAVARAFVRYDISTVPGTPTVIGGTPTVVGGTTTVIGGTTTVVGGTTTVTGGTTTVVGGTTTVVGGTTTVVGGTTTAPTFSTSTTFVEDNGHLLFFTMSEDCDSLRIGSSNGFYDGGVRSNGGVDANASGTGGATLIYGTGVNDGSAPGKDCVVYNTGAWVNVRAQAPTHTWPIAIPTCLPAGTCLPGSSQRATSVNGQHCDAIPSAGLTEPGLYCSAGKIDLSGYANLTGYGFVAPTIVGVRGTVKGFKGLFPTSGGLLFYAYDDNGKPSDLSVESGTSGLSFEGTIFAPNGTVNLSGAAPSGVCSVIPGSTVGGCGFIEAWKIDFSGAFSSFAGLGPDNGGTNTVVTTTTIPGGTTPGTTTVVGGTTNVTGGTTNVTPGTTNVVGGTTSVTGGTTNVIGGTATTVGGTTTSVGGTTNTTPGDINLDK